MNHYHKTAQIKKKYQNSLAEPKPKWPATIQQALIFIHSHLFDARLTIAWMKTACGINRQSFTPRFYTCLHRYPKKYILHHRIGAGKRLLAKTNLPVSQIAIAVGFNSLSSFDNSFKAREGLTPTHWREQN